MAANRKRLDIEELDGDGPSSSAEPSSSLDPLNSIIDLREYDVSYTMRVAIDLDLRVGAWYVVTPVQVTRGVDRWCFSAREQGSESCSLAWRQRGSSEVPQYVETDRILMISYMALVSDYQ